jgi:CRP/FNR family cyclic AMP-dependent transcriptional regulator
MINRTADRGHTQFDCKAFLGQPGDGKKIGPFIRKQTIFSQGDPADAIFYIHRGTIRLSVVSSAGKEATTGILNEGDFFGESCLTQHPLRLCSAIAMTDCLLMRIDKRIMDEALYGEPEFAVMFVAYLLSRNLRYEADLVDQLFNSSEKRLARILILLSHSGKEGELATVIPRLNQETLASMVGTTRSRIGFFLKKFRAIGFVTYAGRNRLQVRTSLVNMVLND